MVQISTSKWKKLLNVLSSFLKIKMLIKTKGTLKTAFFQTDF